MHINATPLLEDRTKLSVLLFRVVGDDDDCFYYYKK